MQVHTATTHTGQAGSVWGGAGQSWHATQVIRSITLATALLDCSQPLSLSLFKLPLMKSELCNLFVLFLVRNSSGLKFYWCKTISKQICFLFCITFCVRPEMERTSYILWVILCAYKNNEEYSRMNISYYWSIWFQLRAEAMVNSF